MQLRPDQHTRLEALAHFLMTEIAPRIEDKGLAFRVLIAANMSQVLAAELQSEDERHVAEVKRLQALLPDAFPGDAAAVTGRAERVEALRNLQRAFAAAVREGRFDAAEKEAAFAHVRQTALETLAVANPRFDLSDEIEPP